MIKASVAEARLNTTIAGFGSPWRDNSRYLGSLRDTPPGGCSCSRTCANKLRPPMGRRGQREERHSTGSTLPKTRFTLSRAT